MKEFDKNGLLDKDVAEAPCTTGNGQPFLDIKKYHKQYLQTENKFYPLGPTTKKLPPGYYVTDDDPRGLFAYQISYSVADIIQFENSITETIRKEFDDFWDKKDEYLSRGEDHKRGYLLHGPQGGGKTCLVKLLLKAFIASGGIVFQFGQFTEKFIEMFRDIESDTRIMVIIEDIDGWCVNRENERVLLSFLDGETPLVNTVIIATTNYPEKLPARIRNRPSRFDRCAEVPNPNEAQREKYLKKKSKTLSDQDIIKWVKDTKNFSIAHIKELLLGVEVFGSLYDEVLDRINIMRKAEASSEKYEKERGAYGFHRYEKEDRY